SSYISPGVWTVMNADVNPSPSSSPSHPLPPPPSSPLSSLYVFNNSTHGIRSFSPADMTDLGTVTAADRANVLAVVSAARTASQSCSWSTSSFAERRRVLRCLMDAIVRHQDELVELSCRQTGKAQLEAELGEVLTSCEKIRWTINNLQSVLSPQERSV